MADPRNTPTTADIIRQRRAGVIIAQGYKSLLFRLIVLLIALYVLLGHVFLLTQVSGNNMFPAVKDGDVLFAYRLQSDYAKNDVVVVEVDGKRHVGRIIGREGDVIMMDESGSLLLNGTTQGGEIMYPTYARDGISYPYVVPDGHIFILGDYRTQTEDSRDFGPIPSDSIVGKVITVLRRRGI